MEIDTDYILSVMETCRSCPEQDTAYCLETCPNSDAFRAIFDESGAILRNATFWSDTGPREFEVYKK